MVKIPSLDDLKKAGASLVESAKSGKLVDQLKSRIESVGEKLTKEGAEIPQGSDPIKTQFQALQTTLKQILAAQSEQAELIRKFETQLGVLEKVINTPASVEVSKPTVVTVTPDVVKTVEIKSETTSAAVEPEVKTEEKKE